MVTAEASTRSRAASPTPRAATLRAATPWRNPPRERPSELSARSVVATKTRDERLFGAACLKVMLERTLRDRAGASEIYRATLSDLDILDEDVDGYLAEHREMIQTALDA